MSSIPWERMSGFADWSLGFMDPDGGTIDFSDSWSKRGWASRDSAP